MDFLTKGTSRMRSSYIRLISLLNLLMPCGAYAVDNKPIEAAPAALEAIIVSVNQELRRIPADADIMVVAGDELTIKDAILSTGARYSYVNLDGFSADANAPTVDDRNKKIRTDRDLVRSRSEGGKGEVY